MYKVVVQLVDGTKHIANPGLVQFDQTEARVKVDHLGGALPVEFGPGEWTRTVVHAPNIEGQDPTQAVDPTKDE